VKDDTEETEKLYLYQVVQGKSQNPTVTLEVNSVPITVHLDTQADVAVIKEKHFESLKSTSRLQPTKAVVRRYSGNGMGPVLALVGCFSATIGRNQKNIQEMVYMVKGEGSTALLSRQAAENIGLGEYHIEQTTKAASTGRGMASHKRHDPRGDHKAACRSQWRRSGAETEKSVHTPGRQVQANPG